MSTFGRQFTDAGLTRTLDHWLDEGPASAPDLTVEAALRTVATTRQRQLRGRLLRMADFHGPVVPVSLTLAGITAVVLVAIGLGMNNGPVPGVENTPTPGIATEEPRPTDLPYGYVLFRNEDDGFELAIPQIWERQVEPAYGEPRPGVTRLGNSARDANGAPLQISVGSADGSVFLCQYLACHEETARTLDELEAEIRADLPLDFDLGSGGPRIQERIVATTLGGEPARFRYPVTTATGGLGIGPQMACTAYGIHEGRPVVLFFACGTLSRGEPAGLENLEAIIGSFRFLDEPEPSAPAEASSPASAPNGFELFRNETDGYEVLVPRAWDLAVEPAYGEPHQGVSRFEGPSSFTDQSPLVISVGSTDGSVYLCVSQACRRVFVRNMTVLESEIVETWQPLSSMGEDFTEVTASTSLDREPARLRYPTTSIGGSLMGVPGACSAYGFHHDRPVVLTFRCDHFRGGEPALIWTIKDIIDSFRFLDAGAVPEPTAAPVEFGALMEFPIAGIELDLPERWWSTSGPDSPTGLTFSRRPAPFGTAVIFAGDARGRVRTCLVPAGPWETCDFVVADSVGELEEAVAPVRADDHGISVPIGTASRNMVMLDGEEAIRLMIEDYEYPAHSGEWITYLVAVHDGRPYVLRFHTKAGAHSEEWLAEFLAGFRFLD